MPNKSRKTIVFQRKNPAAGSEATTNLEHVKIDPSVTLTRICPALFAELRLQNFVYRALFTELCLQSFVYKALLAELRLKSFVYRALFTELRLQNFALRLGEPGC